MRNKIQEIIFNKKLPMLFILIVMVFVILLVSMVISGIVLISLFTLNIIPSVPENRIVFIILYMLLVSLFTGTILTRIVGKRFLHQIYALVDATKEVASGNFSTRLSADNTIELSLIGNSFNEMVKELSNIETLRSDFVGNISHEFKTPIASIRGFARRLKKNSLTDEQRNEYLDIIISESERLSQLSSNVLLLSRLENTEMIIEKSQYSLDEQIRKTVLLLEPQLQKKQLEVDITLEIVKISADEEILSHLWINLLGNAIKFSSEGGTIKITLGIIGHDAVATISDMGIGMEDEVKKHIFDKFYQGDKSRATEGNGLGLSLVKRIIDLEDGKIEVNSELGKGTCFTVSLPIR